MVDRLGLSRSNKRSPREAGAGAFLAPSSVTRVFEEVATPKTGPTSIFIDAKDESKEAHRPFRHTIPLERHPTPSLY